MVKCKALTGSAMKGLNAVTKQESDTTCKIPEKVLAIRLPYPRYACDSTAPEFPLSSQSFDKAKLPCSRVGLTRCFRCFLPLINDLLAYLPMCYSLYFMTTMFLHRLQTVGEGHEHHHHVAVSTGDWVRRVLHPTSAIHVQTSCQCHASDHRWV